LVDSVAEVHYETPMSNLDFLHFCNLQARAIAAYEAKPTPATYKAMSDANRAILAAICDPEVPLYASSRPVAHRAHSFPQELQGTCREH